MKRLLVLLIYILTCSTIGYAQATLSGIPLNVYIDSDFGASANDNDDDTWAFIKLNKWLNNKWDKNGIPYSTTSSDISHKINYTTHHVIVNFSASNNGNAYLIGKEITINNVNSIDYSYQNFIPTNSNPTPPIVDIPYSDIFPNAVPTANTETIRVGILHEYVNHLGNGPKQYSTVYWETIKLGNIESNLNTQIDGIWFKGAENAIIKKNADLHLGYWDQYGNSFLHTNGSWVGTTTQNNWYSNAYWGLQQEDGGSIFTLNDAQNVKFTNLEIHGNKVFHLLGGKHPSQSIQSASMAINLVDCQNITIEEMHVHHNSFDGLRLEDNNWQSNTNLYCKNATFEFNGRTAFAWISGKEVNFDNVDFNYSGKNNDVEPSGYGNPNCGMDMEPNLTTQACENGLFTNCTFIGNKGRAILDVTKSSQVNTVTFQNCTLWDGDSYGLECTGKNLVFNECNIYCPVFKFGMHGKAFATKYNNCTFEDKNNPLNTNQAWPASNILIGTSYPFQRLVQTADHLDSEGAEFSNCNFKVNGASREMFRIVTKGPSPFTSNDYTSFDNCVFEYSNDGITYSSASSSSILRSVLFKGNTSIKNTYNSLTSKHGWETASMEIEGSANPCDPNVFEVDGSVMLTHKDFGANILLFGRNGSTTTTNGYLKARFKSNAGLTFKLDGDVNNVGIQATIGENSTVMFEPTSTIFTTGGLNTLGYKINLYGQLIIDQQSYFQFRKFKFDKNPLGTSLFYIDDQAIVAQGSGSNNFWYPGGGANNFYQYGTVNTNAPCITGGKTGFPSAVVACLPNYSQVHSQGVLALLYNTTDNTCYGGGIGSIESNLMGGTAPLNYNLMPGNVTNASGNFTGLTAGTYSVTATDANNCTISTSVTITQPNQLVWNNPTINNVSCNGGSDGDIQINASGGTNPISYNLIPGNITNATGNFYGLTEGTYSISATDANNCTITTSVTITEPTQLTWKATSSTDLVCNGDSDGTIDVEANGGTPAISYTILPNLGAQAQSGKFTNLTANNYIITATDANSCATSTSITITEPPVCVDFLTLTTTTNNVVNALDKREAKIEIKASNSISGSASIVEYTAGSDIILEDGFEAIASCKFRAHIAPCTDCDQEPVAKPNNDNNTVQTDFNELILYPNPTTGIIKLNPNGTGSGNYQVRSSMGKMLLNGKYQNETIQEINLNNFAKGLYFVLISNGQGVKSYKITLK